MASQRIMLNASWIHKKIVFLIFLILIMKYFAYFLLISACLMGSTSCSKYPQGSKFTLLSKESRMVNEWKLTSYTINGSEFIASQPKVRMAIDKDGTYSWSSTATVLGQTQSTFEHGTWMFSDDLTEFMKLKDGEDIPVGYTILELRANKMALQYYDKITNITYISTFETDN